MEKIAARLTGILLERHIIDKSMYDIYKYGFLSLLEIGSALLTSTLICLGMGMIKEGIIFFAFFIPLRSYLGGVHLKKYWQCYLASCLALFTVLMVVKFVVINPRIICVATVLGVAGTVWAALVDYRKLRNKIYLFIICAVVGFLMLLAGFFYVRGYITMMLLLCCTILLVLGSKIIELLGRLVLKNLR